MAKNGLAIDDLDPLGEVQGDFRNRTVHAAAVVNQSRQESGISWLEAEIRSRNLYDQAVRGVFHVQSHYFLVYDLLPKAVERNQTTFSLQFAIGSRVEDQRGGLTVCAGQKKFGVIFDRALVRDEVAEGQLDPQGGWVSEAYGVLEAAPQLRLHPLPETNLITQVFAPPASDSVRISSELLSDGRIIINLAGDGFDDTIMFSRNGQEARLSRQGVEFLGRAAWIRSVDGRVMSLRLLDTKSLAIESKEIDMSNVESSRYIEMVRIEAGFEFVAPCSLSG